MKIRPLVRIGTVFLLFWGAEGTQAQTVTAELSSPEVQVGQAVELVISATGRSQARLLDDLQVEGIRVVGKSDQFQIQMAFPGGIQVNSRLARTLIADREGEFWLPALRVSIDGQVVATPKISLSVLPGPGGIPVLPALPVPQSGVSGGGLALSRAASFLFQ